MSLKEIATSFAIGALVAALALGAYLWIDGMDEAHTVEPGSVTEVEGGALIGAGADAIDEPIDVQVEWVDPSDEEAFQRQEAQIEDVDQVLELSTTDTEEGQAWLSTPPGSPFKVALPVPEEFDTANVVPIGFSYGEYVVPALGPGLVPNGSGISDTWTFLDGAFLSEERFLLLDVPNLGTPDSPTRVGVVEHAYLETPVAQDTPAQRENETSTPSEARVASLSASPALAADDGEPAAEQQGTGPSETGRFLIHEKIRRSQVGQTAETAHDAVSVGQDMGEVEVDVTGGDGFQLLCHMDDCREDREIEGHSLETRIEVVKEALRKATPEFEALEGQEGPAILPSRRQVNPFEDRYPWRLQGPNADGEPSDPRCESYAGFYNPLFRLASVCVASSALVLTDHSVMPALKTIQETTAHELFHAYQFGMQGGGFWAADYDTSVLEGTTMLAQDWEEPTALSRTLWPPQLTRSITDNEVANGYRAEYLWHHLYENEGIAFQQTGQLFQVGLELENADAFIGGDATSLDGLGDAYWEFAKDLVYEDKDPKLRPQNPTTEAGTCELFKGEDWAPSMMDANRLPHPGPLQVDDYTIRIDPDDHDVELDGPDAEDKRIEPEELEKLTSDVYTLEFEPPHVFGFAEHYWVQITLEAPDAEDPDMRMKLYDEEDSGTEECWTERAAREVTEVGGWAAMDVWEGDEAATLLVSNVELEGNVSYELRFKACPIWAEEGANPQQSYWVVGCEDEEYEVPAAGDTSDPSNFPMALNPAGLLGALGSVFQGDGADDEPAPGDLVWTESGTQTPGQGGITRPSFAYDQVYTMAGNPFPGLLGDESTQAPEGMGGGWGGGSMPAGLEKLGRVTAFDAETGEQRWKTTDEHDDIELTIGSRTPDGAAGLDLQYQPIAANGLVYVQAGERVVVPDWTPTDEEGIPWPSHGVLALDAFDGSPVWEDKPEHDDDREAPRVEELTVCQDSLFVEGGIQAPGYYIGPDEEDHVQTPPAYQPKLWELDAETGDTRKSWDLPRGDASVVIEEDCRPTVGGFASPGNITSYDPETGEVDWTLEDVFDPPPDPNATEHTFRVSEMAVANGSVVLGTLIEGEGGAVGSKIYSFGQDGEAWSYEVDAPTQDPVVVNGTVYLMTTSFEQAAEETSDDPEDPSDLPQIDSRLHAVDAATGEARWVVNASSTMTVTPDRVYVGKLAPLTDPMGASVAALDTATGEVVWANEEDVSGPMALTGAYADGTLYVNTQGQIIALKG